MVWHDESFRFQELAAMTLSPDMTGKPRWSVADYMAMDDERRYEVLDGELLMVPSPNIYHQRSISQLGAVIHLHVVEHNLGEAFDAPFDVVLSEDTVVQPDLTFVRRERMAELFDGHCITGAPDMVVEVLAPATETRDRHRKRLIYAESGVPWLLFVEPKAKLVEVLRLGDDGRYVIQQTAAGDDRLRLELFPELEIDLAKVWFELPEE
jgi:Uma2 family endonuclease